MLKPAIAAAITTFSLMGLTACDVEKTQEGNVTLPQYEVEKKQAGDVTAPKYDVKTPDVAMSTEEKKVDVPTVRTEEKKIEVPKIEVTPAKDK